MDRTVPGKAGELLPCPFCGSVVNLIYAKRDQIWVEHHDETDCPIADGIWASAAQWNTRHDPS